VDDDGDGAVAAERCRDKVEGHHGPPPPLVGAGGGECGDGEHGRNIVCSDFVSGHGRAAEVQFGPAAASATTTTNGDFSFRPRSFEELVDCFLDMKRECDFLRAKVIALEDVIGATTETSTFGRGKAPVHCFPLISASQTPLPHRGEGGVSDQSRLMNTSPYATVAAAAASRVAPKRARQSDTPQRKWGPGFSHSLMRNGDGRAGMAPLAGGLFVDLDGPDGSVGTGNPTATTTTNDEPPALAFRGQR
jgi:hypothetical protein